MGKWLQGDSLASSWKARPEHGCDRVQVVARWEDVMVVFIVFIVFIVFVMFVKFEQLDASYGSIPLIN
jgi:hypothetical protein